MPSLPIPCTLMNMKTILSILLCLMVLIGCSPAPETGMDIYTFSIGKADCSLLSFDGMNVLIDAGEKDDGQDIVESLRDLGIEKLDLVILTHFDKDHIGGFPKLADSIPVEAVILPAYERDSEYFQSMMSSVEEHKIPIQRIGADIGMNLKNASFTIWASTQTYDPDKENDNEMSLITAITYGQTKLLFMGDAEGKWMNDLCFKGYDLTCDILKFPYHGKWQKNIPALLGLSLPEYVIITDSEKNPAAVKTLDALKALNATTFRTIDGSVHLFTNGKKVTVR